MGVESIASNFVYLVLRYEDWNQIKELPAEEMKVLFEIVSAAGFDPKEVSPGKLMGRYRDTENRETYPINNLCPFKVVNQEGEDDYFATGWLDSAFRRVFSKAIRQEENHAKLVDAIKKEILRSIPLKPIQLTSEGDLLRERPPRHHGFGLEHSGNMHSRDDDSLSSCVGVHKYCDGWMDRRRATAAYDAILCRACYLRVLFPEEVKTYEELRKFLAVRIRLAK